MAYTEIEVSNLIQEVEKAFNAHLAKAEAITKPEGAVAVVDGSELAKAEEDKADEKKDKAPPAKEEAPKSDEAPAAEEKEAPAADAEAPAADAPEAPAADAAPAAEGEAPAAPAAAQADHDYDDEDMAAMVQMYQGMSRGELKAHHDAIKQCLDAMGMQEAAAPAAAAPAAPAEAPAAPEAPMAKSEDAAIDVSKFAEATKEVEILKSEISTKETKIAELQKSLDTVTEILTKMVKKSAPAAKAVTKLEAIAKSEVATEEKVLSKTEITAILNKKTMEPSLSKSDRDAINAYYGSGQVSTTGISHLLK
jgi:pyruvate dehydrogenase E2 component (dihydrolipoamide acetyltransferase)